MTDNLTKAPSTTVFETARLLLRRFEDGDIAALPGILNDAEMCKVLSLVPFPYTEQDAEWFVRKGAAHAWAVTLKNGLLIGSVSTYPQLGFWIAKSHWGQGYVTEASRAVLDHHFAALEVDVISTHALDNHRSGAALRKLGFTPTHQKPLRIKSRNCEVPAQVLKLTATAWRRSA